MKPATLIIAVLLNTLSFAPAQESDAIKKDLAQLQGAWSMESGSADGVPMPDEMRKAMKRVCKGDELTVTMGGQPFMKAKIIIDPSKTPKTIDYQMTGGTTKGKTQFGIYELNGDTFKACFASPGDERPKNFSSKSGDRRTLSIWKRNQQPSSAEPEKK